MEKQFYVYILTDPKHSTLYTGVTSNLPARIFEHKEKLNEGFTSKYNTTMLVYYEESADAHQAITREKRVKGGSRQDKIDLIESMNPNWCDLYKQIL
jgi:putative endonuclease